MARVINQIREKVEGGITYKEYCTKYRLPEQAEAESLLLKQKHYILAFEPGKSKSYPVIFAIRQVNKKLKGKAKVLILSDAGTARDMWESEIRTQGILPKNTVILSSAKAAAGIKKGRRKNGRTLIDGLSLELINSHWDILVVDECQSLRSGVTRGKSNFAKLVYKLAEKIEYVWGMTGTLSGNNNIEPFCVLHNLHVADCGKIGTKIFEKQYCNRELTYGPFGSFMTPTSLNNDGEEFMNKAYDEGVMFWGYDDEDDMPPLNIIYKEFKVEKTKWYEDALGGILKCGDYENTVIKSAAIQKAQQSLNGFIYYGKGKDRQTFYIPDYINPKLEWVKDEALKHKNLIIAYRFQEDGEQIAKVLSLYKIQYCSSILEFKERAENKEHIILLLQCMRGKAVNLQICQNIIYYTSDFSFISYKQLIHRVWRRGQSKLCNVTFLINDPGDKYQVEFKIWKSMQNKQSIHDTLMNIKGVS